MKKLAVSDRFHTTFNATNGLKFAVDSMDCPDVSSCRVMSMPTLAALYTRFRSSTIRRTTPVGLSLKCGCATRDMPKRKQREEDGDGEPFATKLMVTTLR